MRWAGGGLPPSTLWVDPRVRARWCGKWGWSIALKPVSKPQRPATWFIYGECPATWLALWFSKMNHTTWRYRAGRRAPVQGAEGLGAVVCDRAGRAAAGCPAPDTQTRSAASTIS